MGAHQNGEQGEEPDEDAESRRLGGALRHPNRTHVTLDNLADLNLADISSLRESAEEAAGGDAADAADGDIDSGSWLALLPTPAEERARRRRGQEADDRDSLDGPDAAGRPGQAGRPGPPGLATGLPPVGHEAGAVVPAAAAGSGAGTALDPASGRVAAVTGEVIAPDAVAPPPIGSPPLPTPPVPSPMPRPLSGPTSGPLSGPMAAPASTEVVVPGRARLQGAYGDTGEHRAWVVPSTRDADAEAEGPARTGLSRLCERWLLELMALAVASVAFVIPMVWLVVVTLVTVVGAVVAFMASGHGLVALPTRAVRRTVQLLRPASLGWVLAFGARTVIGALALPALVTGVAWFVGHGTSGLVAAARAGAWAYGFRVGAVLLCLMVLTSVGDGRQQRAATVRRWARPATNGTVGALAVTCLIVIALAVVGAPHPADGVAQRADGLGWFPAGARGTVDRLRDDIVTTELDSLAECLSDRSGTLWKPFYTVANGLDEPDVARLVAGREPALAPPGDLVTVLLSAHNQLAPWVEAIEVEWPGGDIVRTERADLDRSRPLVDGDALVPATTSGAQWVSSGTVDEGVVLRCSASPVL